MAFPMRALSLGLPLLLVLGGCSSDDPVSRLPRVSNPDPVKAPVTPEEAAVTDVIVLTTNGLQDLDGTGLSTQLVFATYLYSKPFPSPKWADGVIDLQVYPVSSLKPGALPTEPMVASWSWNTTSDNGIRDQNLVGEFYSFIADLSDQDVDISAAPGFNFIVSFTPASGGQRVASSLKTVWNN